ncbi:uncharacterized protein EDB91DRAFT_1119742 [Suillus paluster]|uniref:uncharacterized protein n=1 Tax=Suillus paluster TaxID=48578 RepID=UPI001B87BE31|nr:uncharacterized protein EDB91DRAFT_1119742 [Suillus paluster]KAG1745950.1 hypothetical protein EDB91DRAFT_1119742 [Suillus paluster]
MSTIDRHAHFASIACIFLVQILGLSTRSGATSVVTAPHDTVAYVRFISCRFGLLPNISSLVSCRSSEYCQSCPSSCRSDLASKNTQPMLKFSLVAPKRKNEP